MYMELYSMWPFKIDFFHSALFPEDLSKLCVSKVMSFYWLVFYGMDIPQFNHSPTEEHVGFL